MPKRSWPNAYSNLLYKMGQDFLDKNYYSMFVLPGGCRGVIGRSGRGRNPGKLEKKYKKENLHYRKSKVT